MERLRKTQKYVKIELQIRFDVFRQKGNKNEIFRRLSKYESKKYGNVLYKKWIKQLTKDEIISLIKYKGFLLFSNYQKINSALRENNRDQYQKDIANISSAIDKSIIDEDIICTRNSSVKFLEANNFTTESIVPNTILTEKGFMSTYLFKPKCRFTAKVVLIIRVNKGTHGAYINNVLPWWLGNKSEYEILFDKDTKLKVIEKRTDKKRVYLEVEML